MAVHTAEMVRQKEAGLKKKVADAGDSLAPEKLRALRKSLRRTQRKRRRLVVADARSAKRKKSGDAESGAES